MPAPSPPRSEALQHPHDGALAGCGSHELPNSVTEPDIAKRVRKAYEIAIPADSFGRAVAFAMSQPEDVEVNEILYRPRRQEL
jgi:NADP-dependent 3-hydroxy acid dehydrogenase YdfG